MQLRQKIVRKHRNTHKTWTLKNDVKRPVKNLTLTSRVIGLGTKSLALVLALKSLALRPKYLVLALESKPLALALSPKSSLISHAHMYLNAALLENYHSHDHCLLSKRKRATCTDYIYATCKRRVENGFTVSFTYNC